MFTNRTQAGKQLAEKLKHYRDKHNVLVLAIPRGGVHIGVEVAKYLRSDMSLIIARKLPFPNNPDSGFGAIAEDGSIILIQGGLSNLTIDIIDSIIKTQKEEIRRRIKILRRGEPLPPIENRIVVLVDDGIGMGSTMLASINLCQKQNPEKIIVASPVASPEVARALDNNASVDEVIILEKPRFFRSVAQVYENWYDVPDHEVLSTLKKFQNSYSGSKTSV